MRLKSEIYASIAEFLNNEFRAEIKCLGLCFNITRNPFLLAERGYSAFMEVRGEGDCIILQLFDILFLMVTYLLEKLLLVKLRKRLS